MEQNKTISANELERIVIGTLLIDVNATKQALDIIDERCFYDSKNARVFAAIERLFRRHEAVDLVTVTQELKSSNELEVIGGMAVLSDYAMRVASSLHLDGHCRLLLEYKIKREILHKSEKLFTKSQNESSDVFDLRDQVKELYDFMLQETTKGKQIVHVAEVVNAERENYNLKAENYAKGLPTGVRTGLAGLDRILGGFQNSDLVIVAARPAMGKTALVLTFAKNCNVPSVFFSLEMSSLQLTQRLIMQHAQVDAERYKNGQLSKVELLEVEKARGKVERMSLYIEDKAGIDWQELRSKALKQVERGAKIIFVDYLQLLNVPSAKNRNREAIISEISRELKKVAKDCNVPVIALSQLSRAVEGRGDKIPQLSDLRESGAIEQDADVVMFIHRPEYYGIMQDEGGNSTQGKAEVIIAKHRNGAVGTITTNFISSCTLFTDEEVSQPQSQPMYNPNTDAIKKYHDENPF